MRKKRFYLLICILQIASPLLTTLIAQTAVQNLFSPPETETDTSITIIWDKPLADKPILDYAVYVDGSPIGHSKITNYTINRLKPNTIYLISILIKYQDGKNSLFTKGLKVRTKPIGKIFNVLDFGAKPDSGNINTQSIQKAIDACTAGGTVIIPAGTFMSGALFLKSNMTLYIAKGGVLKGSLNTADYLPMIKTRFEGWEFQAFASLITAGKLDSNGPYNVRNLSIRGEGKISGGGAALGMAMAQNNPNAARGRGRLICLMNCENVNIQGLEIEEPPCWNIHYTYSKNITCNNLKINSLNSKTPNGDGIDPDSSTDSYIFNCTFSTYDDCIAIKSGKNPEGNQVSRACQNIFISNCNFIEGHGLSIGSEISGGIKNVKVTDCELGNLLNGLQIKTTEKRGGYVKDVLVKDCNLQLIKVVTTLPYNNDGEPAATFTNLENFEFTNLNMTNAKTDKPVIYVAGFEDAAYYVRNLKFNNITLPIKSTIFIKHADNVSFENIRTVDGQHPEYNAIENINVRY